MENIKITPLENLIETILPCPFCGETPYFAKNYMPPTVEIGCNNSKCFSNPIIHEDVECIENEGYTVTYSPMFEWHWESLIKKWNTRF